MAKNAATHSFPAPSSASQPAESLPALAPVIEISVRHIRHTPQPRKLLETRLRNAGSRRLTAARRQGPGRFFHLYVAVTSGRAVRRKKERTTGPATMPKHEAQLNTGRPIQQGHPSRVLRDPGRHFCCRNSFESPALGEHARMASRNVWASLALSLVRAELLQRSCKLAPALSEL
jgi:hypothetical protein